jgi:hypothetical protein
VMIALQMIERVLAALIVLALFTLIAMMVI